MPGHRSGEQGRGRGSLARRLRGLARAVEQAADRLDDGSGHGAPTPPTTAPGWGAEPGWGIDLRGAPAHWVARLAQAGLVGPGPVAGAHDEAPHPGARDEARHPRTHGGSPSVGHPALPDEPAGRARDGERPNGTVRAPSDGGRRPGTPATTGGGPPAAPADDARIRLPRRTDPKPPRDTGAQAPAGSRPDGAAPGGSGPDHAGSPRPAPGDTAWRATAGPPEHPRRRDARARRPATAAPEPAGLRRPVWSDPAGPAPGDDPRAQWRTTGAPPVAGHAARTDPRTTAGATATTDATPPAAPSRAPSGPGVHAPSPDAPRTLDRPARRGPDPQPAGAAIRTLAPHVPVGRPARPAGPWPELPARREPAAAPTVSVRAAIERARRLAAEQAAR